MATIESDDFSFEWDSLLHQLPQEHKMILAQTLTTPSFKMVLEMYVQGQRKQLQEISTSREPIDFKHYYEMLNLKADVIEELLTFVNSLTIEPT